MKPELLDQKRWKFAPALYMVVVVAWLAYAALTLAAPIVKETSYSLSNLQVSLVRLSVIVPVLAIWLVAARGAVSFKNYAFMIKGGAEATGINAIANGIIWSLAYVIMLLLPNPLETFFLNTRYMHWSVIANTYPPMILALIAFIFLYIGSQRLASVAKFVTWTKSTAWLALLYGIFCAGFAYIFYIHPIHEMNEATKNLLTNILSPQTLVLTFILPYLLCWFLGFLTTINLARYSHNVQGVIYRHALRNLIRGIVSIVLFAILLQVASLFAPLLVKVSLPMILLLAYVVVILYALGFLFIASGAKRLTRIEAAE